MTMTRGDLARMVREMREFRRRLRDVPVRNTDYLDGYMMALLDVGRGLDRPAPRPRLAACRGCPSPEFCEECGCT